MQDKIQIVFDTSYLESKNYNYDSAVFKRIKNGVEVHKRIEVYLPQIIDCEIRNHLLKDSIRVESSVNKIPEMIRKELLKISFHNLEKFSDEVHAIAKNQYEHFLDELRIEVIKNEKECTDDLWNRYFSQKPPFSEKKKAEFPDAMALLSIFKYFKDKNAPAESIIIVSCDKDWESYCSDVGVCLVGNDIKLIEELNRRDPLLEKPVILRMLNEEAEKSIHEKIKQYFNDIEKEPLDDSEAISFEVLDFSIENISDGEVISVTDNEINLLYTIKYYTEVSYLDSDSWHRDSDSKNIFYTESISGVIESSVVVEVNINIGTQVANFDIEDYDIEECIDIVSPQYLRIDLSEIGNYNSKSGVYYY